MNKIQLQRYLWLMIALVSTCLPAMAGTKTFYSELTATAINGGNEKVCVKTANNTPASNEYQSVSTISQKKDEWKLFGNASESSHTYYLFATGGEGTTIVWKNASTGEEIGRGANISYNITATSDSQSNPTKAYVTMEYVGETEFTVDGIKYEVTGGTTARIARQSTSLSGAITIPATVTSPTSGKVYTPTAISGGAFKDCTGITSVIIQAPVATIDGKVTVSTSDYKSFVSGLPSYSASGSGLFVGCTSLQTVNMKACKFKDTNGGGMFVMCLALKEVIMPDDFEQFDSYDFMFTPVFEEIDLTNTKLRKIGQYTFGMKSVTSDPGCEYYSGSGSNYYYLKGVKKVWVPENTLTTIDANAFLYNSQLELVTDLGKGATHPTPAQVAKYPYLTKNSDISKLSHLGTVTSIGDFAFARCPKLSGLVLSNPAITSIPDAAISQCYQSLQTVILSDKVTTFGFKSFHYSTKVHSMAFPSSGVKVVSATKFSHDGIILPPGTNTLTIPLLNTDKFGPFSSCADAWKKIYIPTTLTDIPSYSFKNANPTDLYCYTTGSAPSLGKNTPFASLANATVHVMPGMSSKFSSYGAKAIKEDLGVKRGFTAGEWSTFTAATDVPQPANVTFYTLSGKVMTKDGENVKELILTPVATEANLLAGVPYICKASANVAESTIAGIYGAEVVSTAKKVNGLQGVLEETSGVYTFVNGTLTENATCSANGASIVMNDVSVIDGAGANDETIVLIEEQEEYILPDTLTEEQQEQIESGELQVVPMEMFAEEDFVEDIQTGEKTVTLSAKNLFANQPNAAPQRAPRKENCALNAADLPALLEGRYVIPAQVLHDGEYYTVTAIDAETFKMQYKLTSVYIPKEVTSINTKTLEMNVNGFMDNVADASGLFYMCFNLEKVEFEVDSEITDLGAGAFFGCFNLKEIVNLPTTLTKISDGMFVGCYSLGMKENQTGQVLNLSGTAINEIGYLAFYKNAVPSGATSNETLFPKYFNFTQSELNSTLGTTADYWTKYEGCGLTKVILPNNTQIGIGIKYGAFEENLYLQQITCDADATVSDLSCVNNLGQWVFYGCMSLTEVVLNHSGITSLPAYTFAGCARLTKITLPAGLKEIGQRALQACEALTTIATSDKNETGVINLPSALEHIAYGAFSSSGVKKVVFPRTLKRISSIAFNDTQIEEVVSNAAVPPVLGKLRASTKSNDQLNEIESQARSYMSTTCEELDLDTEISDPDVFPTYAESSKLPITILYGTNLGYLANGWGRTFSISDEEPLKFADFAVIDGVATCSLASEQSQTLTGKVIVPDNYTKDGVTYTVNAINYHAFAGCAFVTEVQLPATITKVNTTTLEMELNGTRMQVEEASGLFYMCFNLEKVTFEAGSTITDLGAGAFFGCYNLKEIVNLPAALTKISDGMFVGCYSLGMKENQEGQILNLSGTAINEIGYLAFYKNAVPTGATSNETLFPKYFNFSKTEMEIALGTTVDWTQYEGRGLTKVILPNNTQTGIGIKYGAFEENLYLQQITCDADATVSDLSCVNQLGQWVFYGCMSLSEVVLNHSDIISLPAYTFAGCANLTKITLPAGLKEIGQCAFLSDEALTTIATNDKNETGVINLPTLLEHIAYRALESTAVTKVVLPETLKRISSRAFTDCSNLSLVISKKTEAPVLGKSSVSVKKNDQINEIEEQAMSYMSSTCEELDLETVISNPDAFPANGGIFLIVPTLKAESYGESGFQAAFAIGEAFADVETTSSTEMWEAENNYAEYKIVDGNLIAHNGYDFVAARVYNGSDCTQYDLSDSPKSFALPTSADRVEFLMRVDAEYTANNTNTLPIALVELNENHPDNFIGLDADNNWVANSITLTDGGNDYTLVIPDENKVTVAENEDIQYKRTFKESLDDTWQAFFLPFDFELPTGWKAVELADIEVGTDPNDDSVTTYTLKWENAGSSLKAHTPYAVKVKKGDQTIYSLMGQLESAKPEGTCKTEVTATNGTKFTVFGNYKKMSEMRDTYGDDIYCLSGGDFYRPKATSSLNPFRIYLIITKPASAFKMPMMIFNSMNSEDTSTGVFEIEVELPGNGAMDGFYYNTLGHRVNNPAPGIYIRNGRKVVVK